MKKYLIVLIFIILFITGCQVKNKYPINNTYTNSGKCDEITGICEKENENTDSTINNQSSNNNINNNTTNDNNINNNQNTNTNNNIQNNPTPTPSTSTIVNKNNRVSYNGNLKVSGTSLVNQYGEKIQLKGVSSHGLQWFPEFINRDNLTVLRDSWGSNVFRIAMYTEENGYIQNRNLLNTLTEKVDLVISMDMYVIIDWHILSDGNPNNHINESKEFFNYVSDKYKNIPNVIYEICNEPNGVNWNNDIKPYADQIVSVIRNNSKNSIIIVGTGTWDQDILDPINNRINDSNIMYALHFYSGTHTNWLRDRAKQALNNGLPIFVSEWGTSSADGNGGVFIEESQKWVDFMNENNISWINWSLCDKNETSALLKNGSSFISDNNLSESGKFVKKSITE